MATRDFPVPEILAERARQWPGDGEVAPARPAATVMLVRGSGSATEVFMLQRVASMAFAPRMLVFPGGGVDDRDAATDLPWSGPSPAEWAALLAVPEDTARGLVVAAAREVFEECGVLLAGGADGTVAADVHGPEWERIRDALAAREVAFARVLADRGLSLRTDLLGAVDRWVTPEFEPRRYDTVFFVARLPERQEPDDRTSEASAAGWHRPGDLLQEAQEGASRLLPPTIVQLERLAAGAPAPVGSVAAVRPALADTAQGLVLRAELP